MRKSLIAASLLLAVAGGAWAQESPPKQEAKKLSAPPKARPVVPQTEGQKAFRAALADYFKEQADFSVKYRATPREQQRAMLANRPKPDKYVAGVLEVAKKFPKDQGAFDALSWVMLNGQSQPDLQKQAEEILVRDYGNSDRLGLLCRMLERSPSQRAESFLRTLLEQATNENLKGLACFALAKRLGALRDAAANAEAEKLLERAEKEFGKVVYTQLRDRPPVLIGPLAVGELFEIRHLAVGKVAPEIKAEDLDGKEFKLSDYRGKVVLLDFWGNW